MNELRTKGRKKLGLRLLVIAIVIFIIDMILAIMHIRVPAGAFVTVASVVLFILGIIYLIGGSITKEGLDVNESREKGRKKLGSILLVIAIAILIIYIILIAMHIEGLVVGFIGLTSIVLFILGIIYMIGGHVSKK